MATVASIVREFGSPVAGEEASRCLLCHDAPCAAACPKGHDPASFVRSVRFERTRGCLESVGGGTDCAECETQSKRNLAAGTPCELACIHYDFPVRIPGIAKSIVNAEHKASTVSFREIDLSINFCGVKCENPFFLSSSVVASGYDMCAAAFRAGWAGIVYKTIGFITPKEVSPRFAALSKESRPFLGFRNLEQISDKPLAENLDILKRLKRDFPSKVIVSSIMGQTESEWTELARLSEEAGADIIECNFSCPHMTAGSLGSDVGQNPELVARYTGAARRGTKLPILAKMTPNIGNMEPPAIAAMESGANGIAAINTIKSLTAIDPDTLAATPAIAGKSSVSGYSGKAVKPIALRFIHDIASHPALAEAELSGMGGIETWRDALEFILLGCANVQVTTAVMQYGYRIIDDMVAGLKGYMADRLVSSVEELVGAALVNLVSPNELDRDSIVYPFFNRAECVGCGRCRIACADAGHQAIEWGTDRVPRLAAKKCVGCHLCLLVCPHGAIGSGHRAQRTQSAH